MSEVTIAYIISAAVLLGATLLVLARLYLAASSFKQSLKKGWGKNEQSEEKI